MARAVRSGSRVDKAVLTACALLSVLATVLPSAVQEAVAAVFRRTLAAPLIGLQSQAERARSAVVERELTAARIDSLTLRNSQLAELENENERLRRLLGLAHELRWGFIPAEALHVQDSPDQNTVTVTAGSSAGLTPLSMRIGAGASAGVRPLLPVVAPDGLVGLVRTIDPNSSQVILWTHPEFRVSAMAADGSAFGIINPHQGSDPERFLLELRGVAFRESLKPGTLIRSSGLGGVIPRGIPIGTVLGQAKGSEEWARTYLVRPMVKPSDITNVMVLLPPRTSADLTAVWPSTGSVESAVRRMVAAGDSAAAVQAQRTDSIRRDSLRLEAMRRDTLRRDTARVVPPRPKR